MKPSSKAHPGRCLIKGENLVTSFSFEVGFEARPLPPGEARVAAGSCAPHVVSLPSPSHTEALVVLVLCDSFQGDSKIPALKDNQYVTIV